MNPRPFTADAGEITRGEIMRVIVDFCREHCGMAPTLEELAERVRISSASAIARQLVKLERMGLLRLVRTAGGSVSARGIIVVGATWLPGGAAHVAGMAGGIEAAP